jgi:hypothetical protein
MDHGSMTSPVPFDAELQIAYTAAGGHPGR